MNEDELYEIHHLLWKADPPSTITHRGKSHPVQVVVNETQDFRRVYINELQVITQNMRKPSNNTLWINRNPGNSITWVIHRRNGYTGKAITEKSGREFITRIFSLKPERILKTFSETLYR